MSEKKTPLTLKQLPAECDELYKKHYDLPFPAVVSAMIGLMKVLVLRVVETIDKFESRIAELEAFRNVVVEAHEAMQKAETEANVASSAASNAASPTTESPKTTKTSKKNNVKPETAEQKGETAND